MEKVIQLTRSEVRTIMMIVQKYQSLRVVKNILETEPMRVEEFGFLWSDFENLDNELKEADDNCRDWWLTIATKYGLPEKAGFRVNYSMCSLTLIYDKSVI